MRVPAFEERIGRFFFLFFSSAERAPPLLRCYFARRGRGRTAAFPRGRAYVVGTLQPPHFVIYGIMRQREPCLISSFFMLRARLCRVLQLLSCRRYRKVASARGASCLYGAPYRALL